MNYTKVMEQLHKYYSLHFFRKCFTGVVVLSSVNGTFVGSETITGGTSSNTANIQSDAVGQKGVTSFDFQQLNI